jgi:glycerate kinase
MPGPRVLCAPDKFKGSLTATEAADAMAQGIQAGHADVAAERCPVADGGEGTLDVLAPPLRARIVAEVVCGAMGAPVRARLGICPATATGIVELAEACGLESVPPARRDPGRATTFGAGQLIRGALDRGCRRVIIGLGGSASVDGGAGLAQALGADFLDAGGRALPRPASGQMLQRVRRVVLPPPLPARLDVACDVTSPLLGAAGAAAVYGPQKGATPAQVEALEAGLRHLAGLLAADPDAPGAGSAGGAGFGLMAILGATLHRGIDLVLEAIGFAGRCRHASLVLAGEGRLDRQTAQGKALHGVTAAAAALGVPTVAIVGAADGPPPLAGLRRVVDLSQRFGTAAALERAAELLARAAADVVAEELPGRDRPEAAGSA